MFFTCAMGNFFAPIAPTGCQRPLDGIPARRVQGGNNKEVPIMRVRVTLRCNECKQRNYNTVKNKKNDPDRLEMKKYCRFCRKHTVHTETK